MPPVAAPHTMRAASSIWKLGASAHANDMTTMSTREICIMRSLPMASAAGPMIGCASTNGKVKAVVNRATRAGSVARLLAMGGMIGSTARVDSAVAKPIRLRCAMKRAEDGGRLGSGMAPDNAGPGRGNECRILAWLLPRGVSLRVGEGWRLLRG